MRATVPSQHVREFQYVYGAVDPRDGEYFFMTAPKCNSDWMNAFFSELSKKYPDDCIILIMDNARWHTSGILEVPSNIHCLFIPPYTPEMNPIERMWKEIRKSFANKLFGSLKLVEKELMKVTQNLTSEEVKSITKCDWVLDIF
jgi:putative transposase